MRVERWDGNALTRYRKGEKNKFITESKEWTIKEGSCERKYLLASYFKVSLPLD